MSHPEQLTGLDAAFFAMDSATNPMHMGAVGLFTPDRELDLPRLTALLAERASRIERLRLRVRSTWLPLGGAVWQPDPLFDASRNIRVRRLYRPERAGALERCVADWIRDPLPSGRPLWSLDIVPGLPGGDFAMLLKLHHALTDGAGAVQVAAGLLDDLPLRGALARGAEASTPPVGAPSLPRWGLDAAARDLRTVVRTAELGYQVARAVRPWHRSPLATTNGAPRSVSFVRLDAGDLRRIRDIHGGTWNDVVLAVLAGALRGWLRGRGVSVDGMTLRALIPVSLRGRDVPPGGGNRLSGYLCELPVGVADPVRRLGVIRDRMDRNKSEGPLRGAGTLPVLANHVPVAVHRLATGLLGSAGSALFDTVVTNVALPRVALTLDGAALRASFPIVPVAPGQALGVAVTPYRDAVHITLNADARAIADLDVLAAAVEKETARLHETVE